MNFAELSQIVLKTIFVPTRLRPRSGRRQREGVPAERRRNEPSQEKSVYLMMGAIGGGDAGG